MSGTDDEYVEVEPGLAARACDRAHASTNAARVGHTDGFCLACAELYVALGAVLPGRETVRRAVVVTDARHPRDVEQLTDAVVELLEGGHRPEPWTDRHEVVVPHPCSLDRAFDGEHEDQRRELHALERDVLCRMLGDVLYRVRAAGHLDALVWADYGLVTGGGVRLDAWEVPLLLNLVEVLQPRSEGNW